MSKNVLLVRNGCEGCSKDPCLGVLLAESMDASVTAAYVTGDFTWKELRNIYGVDELKWSGAARAGREAKAAAEREKNLQAKEALKSTEKMCACRGIPCETVQVKSGSPLHGALKVAEEKQCDVIVTSNHPRRAMKTLSHVKTGRTDGQSRIPMLIHHVV
jgi:nucleotide-binding universal stress UspA family protein